MKKLKWEFKKGARGWCDEYYSGDFRIVVYPMHKAKPEYALEFYRHEISRFKKISSAKNVAQLIHNG